MKNLYVCGDSYSLLEDSVNWGQLIAKHYDLNLLHKGKQGVSNYHIFRQTLFDCAKLDHETIAIIGWSFPHRNEYWNHKGCVKQVTNCYESITDVSRPMGFYEPLNEVASNDLARKIYKLQLMLNPTNEMFYMETIYNMIALDGYLTSKGIKHMFVFARRWVHDYNTNFSPLSELLTHMANIETLINPINYGYIEDAVENGFSHSETFHLFGDGHAYVAQQLIKHLEKFAII